MDDLKLARRCAEEMWAGDAASRALGIEIEVLGAGNVVARMVVRKDMVNGLDVCHGGLVFTLGDTAFAFACNAYDSQTVAAAAHIDFLRPGNLGDELVATASEDHRGRKSVYYTITIRNQRQELVAIFRGRGANTGRPLLSD